MSSHYGYGKRKELQVGEFLERRGFEWWRTLGSRGPVDLIASRGRLKPAIQAKAARKDFTTYTRLSIDGEEALIRSAACRKALAALALVSGNYVWLVTVPDEAILAKGKLLPLSYEYPDEG